MVPYCIVQSQQLDSAVERVNNCRQSGCHIALPSIARDVGFVFICPGRYEEKHGRPCAGQTGVMLDAALSLLVMRMPKLFPDAGRYQYLITNAWPQVEYRAKTKRGVPLISEISRRENVEGLYQEIKSLRNIVACGNLAHHTVKLCRQMFDLEASVAYVTHTSRPALGFPSNANLHTRLKTWATSVVEQLDSETQ